MRILKLAATSGVGLATVFTVVMGFAHTRAGRPLLVVLKPVMGLMGSKAACPFGYDAKPTLAAKEAGRLAFAESHRGQEAASGRPALGFTLDATTPQDVMAWAKADGVACKEKIGGLVGSDLECRDVPERLLPAGQRGASVGTMWLTFGESGTLTSVVAVRSDPSPDVISKAFASVNDDVAEKAGAPAQLEGHGTAAELSSGFFVQSSAEYRFQNYYAVARASNTGKAYVMTEEYRSL
jgi:hypothetical protein